MNKLKTFLLLIAVTFIMTACNNSTDKQFGVNFISDKFEVDRPYCMNVYVRCDVEPPIVFFITPDKRVINGEDLEHETGNTWTQYFIIDAAPGTWQIKYDKLSNQECDIYYTSYMESPEINALSYTAIDDKTLSVQFDVSCKSKIVDNYTYTISAYQPRTEENRNETLIQLGTGTAKLDETITINVNTSDLSSGEYLIYVSATQEYGIEEAWSSKKSETAFIIP